MFPVFALVYGVSTFLTVHIMYATSRVVQRAISAHSLAIVSSVFAYPALRAIPKFRAALTSSIW